MVEDGGVGAVGTSKVEMKGGNCGRRDIAGGDGSWGARVEVGIWRWRARCVKKKGVLYKNCQYPKTV